MADLILGRVTVLAGLLALGMFGAADAAQADEYVLATSKTHKLQVVAEGGSAWCAQTLRLRLVLEPDSPDIGNSSSQIDMMNRLKTPIGNDCKTALSAKLSVVEPGPKEMAYEASAAGGWAFTAVQKVSPPPVPALASPPPVVKPPASTVWLIPPPAKP